MTNHDQSPYEQRSDAVDAASGGDAVGGPIVSDSVGAELLTAIATPHRHVKERHDSLEFLSHAHLRHQVRIVIGLDRFVLGAESSLAAAEFPWPFRRDAISTPSSAVIVPLATLDRHSRTTTHVLDESNHMLPLLTTAELYGLFGGGLVAYASHILGTATMPAELELFLRRVPSSADNHAAAQQSEGDSQAAADGAFREIQRGLLEFSSGFDLLRRVEFLQALRVTTGSLPLVVSLDPLHGATRILTLTFDRPLTGLRPSLAQGLSSSPPGLGPTPPRSLLAAFWHRAGTVDVFVPIGIIGGCDRYALDATAPFDTWFGDARVARLSPSGPYSDLADISQRYRLTYQLDAGQPMSGLLIVNLRSVFSGVARISLLGSTFILLFFLLGTLRVATAPGSQFFPADAGTGASVLLLFPGVAVAALAGRAAHSLTARLQFPMRFLLWSLAIMCFIVALASAIRLGRSPSIVLWSAMSAGALLVSLLLRQRARVLRGIGGVRQGPPMPAITPAETPVSLARSPNAP